MKTKIKRYKEEEELSEVTASEDVVKLSETTSTVAVNKMNPAFDPDIPEQKQRWLR